jgi:DNA-nicking Smr family endonuclease
VTAGGRAGDGDAERAPDPDAPVVVPIEDALDLHPFAPRDVASVVDEYLREAAARGLAEVRLIHGRGIGVQRAAVRALLAAHPHVERYFDAPPERGGWGATVAVLRR